MIDTMYAAIAVRVMVKFESTVYGKTFVVFIFFTQL